MRKYQIVLCLLLFSVSGFCAQESINSDSDYVSAFTTFSGLVSVVPFIVEWVKKKFRFLNSKMIQLISWGIGIGLTLFGWCFDLGFLNTLEWWQMLMSGLGVSLASNGLFDTGFIEWVIRLFNRKKSEAEDVIV